MIQGFFKDSQVIFTAFGSDNIQRTVNDAFGDGLFAVNHYDVNELSQQLRSELGIWQDFTLTNNATSWHFVFLVTSGFTQN